MKISALFLVLYLLGIVPGESTNPIEVSLSNPEDLSVSSTEEEVLPASPEVDVLSTPPTLTSLSAEEVLGFLEGKGMGMAKPAEMNHFPGPMHVLELREELDLSEDQIAMVYGYRLDMLEETKSKGSLLITMEYNIDQWFLAASKGASVDETDLSRMLRASALLRGQIRYTHLHAHLLTAMALSPQQIMDYDTLRGYGEESSDNAPMDHATHDHNH
ncbi:hypothetical protein H8D30_04280 [bacterium]|nr:hypothetical protein [bacterium]